MIPSNHKITVYISPVEKTNLPCSSSPVFPHITSKNNMSTSSTVCQGLQSCLDPLSLEPRVLITPTKQALSFPWPKKQPEIPRTTAENTKNFPIEKNCEKSNTENVQESNRTWNFTQSPTNPNHNFTKLTEEQEQVYVHPLVKRSTSSLSTRSLEMCTESLGSETGNGIDLNMDEFITYQQSERQSCSVNKQVKTREYPKKVNSFPPPLTSISGSDGVQVQTHREGGRLVIKAFSFTSSSNYFRAERENGRLRLSLMKDEFRDGENKNEEGEEVEEESRKHCDESDEEGANLNGGFWGRDDGGKVGGVEWSSSNWWCNGDMSSGKKLPSLPFCVAIS